MADFFNPTTFFIFVSFLLVLNFSLLIWLWRLTKHYNQLIKNTDEKSLVKVFTSLQKTLAQHEKKLIHHHRSLLDLDQKLKNSIQQVVIHRFNPFQHTGGKQSFILAFLDGHQNGVLITSLHSRENTRFYVKSIKEGEGVEHALSPEEAKLIKRQRRS